MIDTSKISNIDIKALAADAAYWACASMIVLANGEEFSFVNRPYLIEPMQDESCVSGSMKASGGGFPIDIKTPIPTPDGWVLMEDIKVGNKVFGKDGKIYTVLEVHGIKYNKQCYRVIFSDKSSIVCDGDHLWSLTDMWHYRYVKQVTIKTIDILNAKKKDNRNRYVLDVAKPLDLPENKLPIDPYVLGLWLGDGNSCSNQITCGISDSVEYSKTFKELGIEIEIRDRKNVLCGEYKNIKIIDHCPKLRLLGVLKNKHIPMIYLRASYQQRLELLRGLMDTDGSISKSGKCEFYNINTVLIGQVKELVLSLGIKARISAKCFSTNWDKTELKPYKIYRVTFKAYSDMPVAKIKRKKENQISRIGNHPSITERRRIIDVVPVDSVPVRCITVDSPDHLFLAGEDFISVHNSECQGILPSLHGMIYGKYQQGVGYFFPTDTDMQDYVKSRFNPLIQLNKESIGKWIKSGRAGTDSAGLKRIGNANLFLRGSTLSPGETVGDARKSTKATGIQFDRLVVDEIDQIHPEAIAKMRKRMTNAKIYGNLGRDEERYIANPSDEDRGIDLYWQKSNKKWWNMLCVCGHYTNPVRYFLNDPEKSIGILPNGRGYIKCEKCEKPLGYNSGMYISECPGVTDLNMYQWSHLSSAYVDPLRILKDYRNPPEDNLGDIMRLDLGLAYSSKDEKLRKDVVLSCCSNNGMPERHMGPCAMGVDNDDKKHVVIGIRTGNDRYEIVKVAVCETFGEVHDLAIRYNVKSEVDDLRPNADSAREHQKSERHKVFLNEYTESPLNEAFFNENTGVVKSYRTGIFDSTHRIISNGQIVLPRRCAAIEDFATQCCNCVKSKEVDKQKGIIIYRYKKTGNGNDHYRNALNYFILASSGHRIRTVNPDRKINRQTKAKCDYDVVACV